MVKAKEQNNVTIYQCEECGLWYRDKEIAEQCQAWCKTHQSCNLDIIQHAITEHGNQPTT